jgi:Mn-containing catalase
VNTSQGKGDVEGPWNSGDQWERIDDLEETMPIDDGDGTASVGLSSNDQKVAKQLAARTMSDPDADPRTGVDLGVAPSGGLTSDGNQGGAKDIFDAVEKTDAMTVQ